MACQFAVTSRLVRGTADHRNKAHVEEEW
jgi:hypothetical protein